MQHLRPERRADKLPATSAFLTSSVSDRLEHVGHCLTVLSVEVGVDFVKEIKRGWVAFLDGEDEGKGAETWKLGVSVLLMVVEGGVGKRGNKGGNYSSARH